MVGGLPINIIQIYSLTNVIVRSIDATETNTTKINVNNTDVVRSYECLFLLQAYNSFFFFIDAGGAISYKC